MQKITIIEKGDVFTSKMGELIVLDAPPIVNQFTESEFICFTTWNNTYWRYTKKEFFTKKFTDFYKYSHNARELLKEYENKLLKLAKLKNFLKGGKL